MSGWDFDSNSGGSNSTKAEFTKFPVGVTRITVIDPEPNVRWTHWIQKHKRSINCPGKGCPICEIRHQEKANKMPYTYPMSRRFAINIYNHETEKAEIMEQGITVFNDIRDVMQDLKDEGIALCDATLKVRRRGTTKDDTTYRFDKLDEVLPVPEGLEFIKLSDYFKPHTNEQILRIVQGEDWNEVMKRDEVEENEEQIEIR